MPLPFRQPPAGNMLDPGGTGAGRRPVRATRTWLIRLSQASTCRQQSQRSALSRQPLTLGIRARLAQLAHPALSSFGTHAKDQGPKSRIPTIRDGRRGPRAVGWEDASAAASATPGHSEGATGNGQNKGRLQVRVSVAGVIADAGERRAGSLLLLAVRRAARRRQLAQDRTFGLPLWWSMRRLEAPDDATRMSDCSRGTSPPQAAASTAEDCEGQTPGGRCW
eukprot:jgi/Mesen1/5489/ME000276S04623